jgi:hypothetical protein
MPDPAAGEHCGNCRGVAKATVRASPSGASQSCHPTRGTTEASSQEVHSVAPGVDAGFAVSEHDRDGSFVDGVEKADGQFSGNPGAFSGAPPSILFVRKHDS